MGLLRAMKCVERSDEPLLSQVMIISGYHANAIHLAVTLATTHQQTTALHENQFVSETAFTCS